MKLPLLCLSLVLCVASQGALAATIERQRSLNATGACQSALPVFDGNIRKRPKAVQNEGDSQAFITCSFTSDNPPTEVHVYASSIDGQPHQLSCQGIPGYHGESTPAFVRTWNLNADGSRKQFKWEPAAWEMGATEFPSRLFSISCALEPGVSLNNIDIFFDDEIGA